MRVKYCTPSPSEGEMEDKVLLLIILMNNRHWPLHVHLIFAWNSIFQLNTSIHLSEGNWLELNVGSGKDNRLL